jgi:2-polyprenyl-3-methyl-5-hydroxy-6-metoxy-1,4-benzoquinol methylase
MRIAARSGSRASLSKVEQCGMRKEAPAGRDLLEVEKGTLQQIREEMQRSYQPRERNKSIEQAESSQPSSGELVELRSAIAALCSSYAIVGQTPPEPPTFRGRIGARLVKLVQRLLFWYTPQIVHFQYSALRAFESALRVFEEQLRSVQRLETENIQPLEAELRSERRDRQAAMTAAASRTEILERRLEALRLQALPRMDCEIARLSSQQTAQEERINREIARLRAQQTVQEGRIALLIQARNDLLELSSPATVKRLRQEELHNMDALYAALEDEFRGSRLAIKERLSVYLPKLADAAIGSESMPILDVGCGRGEWLELLREHQLYASGIDLNRVVLAICQELGLPVMEADAVEHLRSLPESSLGAVTAFHVIEHLALPQLLALLDEAKRTLKPGGVAIFETPNPNNLFVSSRYFYLDPTHRHPIPPLLGRFLAEARGFERVEILELHPWPVAHRVDTSTGGDVAARFNECFYGPQDYAIIGWKA